MRWPTITNYAMRNATWFSLTLTLTLSIYSSPALAEQRNFPTSEPGSTVTFLNEAEPGHPTGCIVAITSGLPKLALSISIFSNNSTSIMVGSQQPVPSIAPEADATVKVNSILIFARVKNSLKSGTFYLVNLSPRDGDSIQKIYDAINQIAYTTTRIDVVADDAQLPGIVIQAMPGLADALTVCQSYMVGHPN